ncbi:MAG TPA: hypothetical protein VHD31_00530 [Candidatus Paceibacterota bacterium]|nr:hypothetical protein [Candidatus Paceibacterota bacterium]
MPSRFLPSAQFVLIVGSIAASGALVLAAQYLTGAPRGLPSTLTATTAPRDLSRVDPNWEQTLLAIQGKSAITAAVASSTVDTLLDATKSTNLTTTVAQSLLVNLFDAKSQGLGSDIPTQNQLIAQATAQIQGEKDPPAYASSDLTLSTQTPIALKAYGNAVMTAMAAHPGANYNDTLFALGYLTDSNDPAQVAKLANIQKEYRALVRDLAKVPVPPTLAPLHLQILNNLSYAAGAYSDMEVAVSDPLRSIAGLQTYQSLVDETTRVFINIAQILKQNGILFTKDEPGSAWATLLSLQ